MCRENEYDIGQYASYAVFRSPQFSCKELVPRNVVILGKLISCGRDGPHCFPFRIKFLASGVPAYYHVLRASSSIVPVCYCAAYCSMPLQLNNCGTFNVQQLCRPNGTCIWLAVFTGRNITELMKNTLKTSFASGFSKLMRFIYFFYILFNF